MHDLRHKLTHVSWCYSGNYRTSTAGPQFAWNRNSI